MVRSPLYAFPPAVRVGFGNAGPALSLATAAIFASSSIAGKLASEELSAPTIILIRSLLACGFLGLLASHQGTLSLKVRFAHIVPIGLMGAFGIVGYVYFFLSSLDYTTVSNTAIIGSLAPAATALAASVFIGERLSGRRYAGVMVCLVGVLLLISKGNWRSIVAVEFNYGDRLMLCAVGCSVGYGLIAKRLSGLYPTVCLTFYMTIAAVLILTLWVNPVELVAVGEVSTIALLALAFMGIVASGVGYLLYNMTVKAIGPTLTSCSVYSATPLLVMTLSNWLFQEPVTALSAASALTISAGLYLALMK